MGTKVNHHPTGTLPRDLELHLQGKLYIDFYRVTPGPPCQSDSAPGVLVVPVTLWGQVP